MFIAQQARLLQNEEPGALSPSRLQYEITALKETNPDLPETVSSYIMFLSVIFQFCFWVLFLKINIITEMTLHMYSLHISCF